MIGIIAAFAVGVFFGFLLTAVIVSDRRNK